MQGSYMIIRFYRKFQEKYDIGNAKDEFKIFIKN